MVGAHRGGGADCFVGECVVDAAEGKKETAGEGSCCWCTEGEEEEPLGNLFAVGGCDWSREREGEVWVFVIFFMHVVLNWRAGKGKEKYGFL